MDLDRPSTSRRSADRPVTRWRREQPDESQQQQQQQQQQQRLERPVSRRGVKTDISEFGMSRPPTSGRIASAVSRPPSPSIAALGRVPTASQLTRIGSGLSRGFAQPNAMVILDRPITQQGLAGVRPGSARAVPKLTRQIQDKMYYKQLLQMKIQELNQEITSIAGQVGDRGGGDAEYHHQYYSGMTGDSSEYQDSFDGDYDTGTTEMDVEQEARALKEIGDSIQDLALKRKHAKKRLDELAKEVDFKRKIAERFADSMDAETKAKYDEAFEAKAELQREIDRMQEDYDKLLKRQSSMKEKIYLSPMRHEIIELHERLVETDEERRGRVEDEDDEEGGGAKIDEAEKQIAEIERKIADAQLELDRLDDADEDGDDNVADEEEPNARPKTAKSKKDQLIAKMSSLESQLVDRLERISANVNERADRAPLSDEDMGMFAELMEQNFEGKADKSYEELKLDYLKLSEMSSKLETLESKIFADKKRKKSPPTTTIADVLEIEQERSDEIMVEESEKRRNYDELIGKIERNEIYRFVDLLENKLKMLAPEADRSSSTDGKADDDIAGQADDTSSLTKAVIDLTTRYNAVLINRMKFIY